MREDMDRPELERLTRRKPRWIVRWGITILLAVFILIFMVMKQVLSP